MCCFVHILTLSYNLSRNKTPLEKKKRRSPNKIAGCPIVSYKIILTVQFPEPKYPLEKKAFGVNVYFGCSVSSKELPLSF